MLHTCELHDNIVVVMGVTIVRCPLCAEADEFSAKYNELKKEYDEVVSYNFILEGEVRKLQREVEYLNNIVEAKVKKRSKRIS